MSAELLREAAALMRERAEAAVRPVDSDHWIVDHEDPYANSNEVYRGPVGAGDVASAVDPPTATHIASWHPVVALAVADWLDCVAEDVEYDDSPAYINAALAVARAYLGA